MFQALIVRLLEKDANQRPAPSKSKEAMSRANTDAAEKPGSANGLCQG